MITTLNIPQERMLDVLVDQMADWAANSDLPIDKYLNGLQAFIFGSAGDRTLILKKEPELYKRMERHQNQLLNILAAADGPTLGLMTKMIDLLRERVKQAL